MVDVRLGRFDLDADKYLTWLEIDTAYPLIADAAGKMKNNATVRFHHGMVLAKKGKNKEAAAELKAALSLDPKFPGAEDAKKTLEGMK